jgi:hypothetical protein
VDGWMEEDGIFVIDRGILLREMQIQSVWDIYEDNTHSIVVLQLPPDGC